jgi:hypothetical protein
MKEKQRMKASSMSTIQPGLGLPHRRMGNFLLTIGVMVLSFFLYDLGLFGGEGPLTPPKIGIYLDGLGVTRRHVLVMSLSFLIFSATWNWIYNFVSHRLGERLTCLNPGPDGDELCGARVKRETVVSKVTGKEQIRYVCSHGHRSDKAHFHPVAKGTVSHCVWVMSLVLCCIVLFLS